MKPIKRFKYFIIILSIKIVVKVVPLFPRIFLLWSFGSLGKVAFHLLKKEREKTINNLRIAFEKDMSEEELAATAKKVFVHQSKNLADYIYTINVTRKEEYLKYVDIVGEEHLKKAYDKGKGVICLICHMGSWEFSAITTSILGYSTTAVSKALRHPKMNEMMVGFRQKRGLKNLNRGNTYPLLIEALNQGDCLIIMIDQDTKVKSVFVDFFGKPAYTPIGAAMLALDTEAAVVPMAMKRLPNNKHQFTIKPALDLIKTGDRNYDLVANTKMFSETIEDYIKEDPSQWVWMHRRWKTTPEKVQKLIEDEVIKDTSLLEVRV